MLDKNYLVEIVQKNYPDLVSTNFSFNNLSVSSFTESKLLPFLIYQNTIDSNNRLIGLFLPENFNIINLVPFYIIMGHYRKALNKIMLTKKYESQYFKNNEKQVVFDSTICTISNVDFIAREITLRTGKGLETSIPFNKSYNIRWDFENAFDLQNKIESFDKIDKATRYNIFTLPFSPSDDQYEGVIIFTNTSKFESILRNVRISGNDLRDYLNIQKATFPYGDNIKFELLSKSKTKSYPVSVVVARLDAFRAFVNIISTNPDRLKHLKTIVIDDFDELIIKWERNHSTIDELKWLKENYYRFLNDKELKDIYLISKNYNLDIHNSFLNSKINYFPWLIQPLEDSMLNDVEKIEPTVEIVQTSSEKFNSLIDAINQLLEKWRTLAKSYYCQGDIIIQVNFLQTVKSRISTFCDPYDFASYLKRFEENLSQFKIKWFNNNIDGDLINETNEFLSSELVHSSLNCKLTEIKKILECYKGKKDKVLIISDNRIEQDKKYLTEKFKYDFRHIELEVLDVNESLKRFMVTGNEVNLIFYLSYRNKLLKTSLTNILGDKQIFILDDQAVKFGQYTAEKVQKIISEISSDDKKYILLNTEEPSSNIHADGRIKFIVIKRELGTLTHFKDQNTEDQPFDFDSFVKEVLDRFNYETHNSGDHDKLCKIFFEDGTSRDFPQNRKFFHYDEDDHEEELTKYLKTADKLNRGDQIIIPKRNEQLKDLLESALNADTEFEKSIKIDSEWRNKIKKRIGLLGNDYAEFRDRLSKKGFSVESPLTIKNWIEKDTQSPHNFRKILIALVELDIVEGKDIPLYLSHNKRLKSIQITFVREAIKKLISHLHGVDYYTEDDLIDEKLLNRFIELIEIKKVDSIVKF